MPRETRDAHDTVFKQLIRTFCYPSSQTIEPNRYEVRFPDRCVLGFDFLSVQLNRMNWREFIDMDNPAALALLNCMKIDPKDRPEVKWQCLRRLMKLRLGPGE